MYILNIFKYQYVYIKQLYDVLWTSLEELMTLTPNTSFFFFFFINNEDGITIKKKTEKNYYVDSYRLIQL